jgi:hypothetical protein
LMSQSFQDLFTSSRSILPLVCISSKYSCNQVWLECGRVGFVIVDSCCEIWKMMRVLRIFRVGNATTKMELSETHIFQILYMVDIFVAPCRQYGRKAQKTDKESEGQQGSQEETYLYWQLITVRRPLHI